MSGSSLVTRRIVKCKPVNIFRTEFQQNQRKDSWDTRECHLQSYADQVSHLISMVETRKRFITYGGSRPNRIKKKICKTVYEVHGKARFGHYV
jgi:hypothetical protein